MGPGSRLAIVPLTGSVDPDSTDGTRYDRSVMLGPIGSWDAEPMGPDVTEQSCWVPSVVSPEVARSGHAEVVLGG